VALPAAALSSRFLSNRADLAIGMTLNPLRCKCPARCVTAKESRLRMQILFRKGELANIANVAVRSLLAHSAWLRLQLASHVLQRLPPTALGLIRCTSGAGSWCAHSATRSSRALSPPDVEGCSLPALSVLLVAFGLRPGLA